MTSTWPGIEESKRKKAYHLANIAELKHGERAGLYQDAKGSAIALEWLAVDARRRLEALPNNLASLFLLNPDTARDIQAEALQDAAGVFANLSLYQAMVRGDDG